MRKFDWFISGAVALLYSDVASQHKAERGVAENFDPERDASWIVAYSFQGEIFVNWPFVFASIATACFLTILAKSIWEQRKK